MIVNPDPLGLGGLNRHRRLRAAAERLPYFLDPLVRPRRWRQQRMVKRVLADPAAVAAFGRVVELPPGYGIGIDERVVEYPWLLGQNGSGVECASARAVACVAFTRA
jgi:hypothetical protein